MRRRGSPAAYAVPFPLSIAPRRGSGKVASPPPARTPRKTARRLSDFLAMGGSLSLSFVSRGESGSRGHGAEALAGGDLGQECHQLVAVGFEPALPGGQLGLVAGRLLVAGGVAEDVAQ